MLNNILILIGKYCYLTPRQLELTTLALGVQCGFAASGGQGYLQVGNGGVPGVYNAKQTSAAWPYVANGLSRLNQPFDFMIINHGINGIVINPTAAAVTGFLTQFRAQYPAAKMIVMSPWLQGQDVFGAGVGFASIGLTGYNNYVATNPNDHNVFYVPMTTILDTIVGGRPSGSGLPYLIIPGASVHHPSAQGDAIISNIYTAALKKILFPDGNANSK